MKYYDFPLVSTLRSALGYGGDLRALLGPIELDLKALAPDLAVTFVVNHDIPQNPMPDLFVGRCRNTDRYGDPVNERLASAFVLGRRGGLPLVYSDRGVAGGDDVPTDAYRFAHARCDTAQMVRFRRVVGDADEAVILAAPDTIAFRRGRRAFVVIHKGGGAGRFALDAGQAPALDAGVYVDLLTGARVTVGAGAGLAVDLPARSAALYVREDLLGAAPGDPRAAGCEAPPDPVCTL